MTDAQFQGRVLRELGQIRTEQRQELEAVRGELAGLTTAVVRFEERQDSLTGRVDKLEGWRESQRDRAEQTGQHEVAKLQRQIEVLTVEQQVAQRDRRRQWLGFVGKAALIVLGSVLAVLIPAIVRAMGWS